MKLGVTLPLVQRFASAGEFTQWLYDSNDRRYSLFENSTLGVALTDSAFRFLIANSAFLAMIGYSSEELQQLSLLDICVDEAGNERRVALRELREGARLQYEIETQYRRKDGTFLPVNTYCSVVSGRAPYRQFLTVTVDITARRAAEEALRAAQSELGRVARLTTVGAMAASIGHELNQPLASIVTNGNAGLRWLDRSEPNLEEARSAFERVVNEGHRAAQIVGGIRAMFRKESGERSPVAINELVCDVLSTSLSELKSGRVSLALELLDELPPVLGDRVQLQQVLLNLFTNAVDAMVSVGDRPHMPNAVWFGREERVKQAFSVPGLDPCARILDTDKHAILEMLRTHIQHMMTISNRDHCVDCVSEEIQ